MRKSPTNFAAAAAVAAALFAPVLAHAVSFTFTGQAEDGPLVGTSFSGSFEFDASVVAADFEGELPLSAFSMAFAGASYDLASADATPTALYYGGDFLGVSYIDADAADPSLRPIVSLIPGYFSMAESYLAYDLSTDPGDGMAGFGSLSITAAVPEPATWALWALALGALGALSRRR